MFESLLWTEALDTAEWTEVDESIVLCYALNQKLYPGKDGMISWMNKILSEVENYVFGSGSGCPDQQREGEREPLWQKM